MTLAMAVQFGPFRLFPTKRLLLRDGDAVCLTPKAFDTLVLLIEQRDRVVSKRELLDELWPNTAVEDATLSQHVFMLRRALADSEGPDVEYIATVQRRGYRFVAPVTEIDCVKDGKADAAAGASADAAHDRLRLFSATKRRHAGWSLRFSSLALALSLACGMRGDLSPYRRRFVLLSPCRRSSGSGGKDEVWQHSHLTARPWSMPRIDNSMCAG